jgi:PadR family transcriptional regulator AphA
MAGNTVSFRYFILGLLTQQPMSGYDIKRFLKSLSWLIGSPSFGSLYPALHALLKDELVTVKVAPRESKPPRKIYSITDAGRQTLNDWIDQPATSRAPLKAFAMRLILADNFSHAGLIAHLQQRRDQVAAYHAALQQTTRVLREKTNPGQHLALDYGSALAIAELDWLDSTLNRLSQSCQQPLPVEVVQSDSATPTA